MEPQSINTQPAGRHEKLLTEVIQKQMELLGPNIALATARSVKGLIITDQGVVTNLSGDHQELTRQLVEQFMALSGLIVKKTLEPLLAAHPDTSAQQQSPAQVAVDQALNEIPVAKNLQMENNN
ncbi:MAG: hypothetical protein Q7S38_00280 [bacterium]|nr:hypothetical protein [bacterium]